MKEKYIKVGKRIYSDPSVVHLVKLHREVSQDPEKIIRHLARHEIANARNHGWSGPPFAPQILASIMGIPCEKSEKLFRSEDAELHPIGEGRSAIKYNPNRPKTRQNFSIAHEIAHTFFPEYEDQYKTRHRIGQFNPANEVEFLCDLGASEIIMPTPEFDLDVKSMGISLKTLEKLSKLYEASSEATAIRMITTNLGYSALMVLDYSHKPSELRQIENARDQLNLFSDCPWVPPPMKLRVQYSVPAKNFSVYIPKHKSIEEFSPLYEVSVTRKPFQGNTTLNFTNPSLDTYVEAIALNGTHNPDLGSRVLVILLGEWCDP